MEGPRGPIDALRSFLLILLRNNFTTKRLLGGIPKVHLRYLFHRILNQGGVLCAEGVLM